MTLYTDGTTPATETEIASAYQSMLSGRRRAKRGGRKSKLTPSQIADIRLMLSCGCPAASIAPGYGVSPSTIRRLVRAHRDLAQPKDSAKPA